MSDSPINSPRNEESLFHEALELPPSQIERFLSEAIPHDVNMQRRILNLLKANHRAEHLLPTPPPAGVDFAHLLSENDPLLGQKLDGFTVIRQLGSGGMGAVYFAEQHSPKRNVAIKVLHSVGHSRAAIDRFRLEAEVVASLSHPCVAHVYAAGIATIGVSKVPYLAMELVEGHTLLEYLKRHPTSIPGKLQIFIRICHAVEHAHRKGVIHRDLKPGNIMVSEDGAPKVLDFGVARLLTNDGSKDPTLDGQVIGTLQYMSPEQVAGDSRRIDTRSDVYSLGMLLFEMLASRRPYDLDSTSVSAAAHTILNHRVPSLSRLAPECPEDLETIVEKALEKEAERRYQSAADLASDIEALLAGHPIRARPATRTYIARKFISRNKRLSALAALVFLFFVLATVGTSLGLYRAMQAQRDTQLARTAESLALVTSRQHEADAVRLAKSAEFQSYVANISAASGAIDTFDVLAAQRFLDRCPPHLRHWEWQYLSRRIRDDFTPDLMSTLNTAPTGSVWDLAVSDDGQWTASSCGPLVCIWNPRNGERRDVRPVREGAAWSGDIIHGVALSADGSVLACAHAWHNVATLWDVQSARLLQEFVGHKGEVKDVAISPDGLTLATASFDSTVGIWDTRTGVRRFTLRGHTGHVHSVHFSPDGQWLASASTDPEIYLWDVRDGTLLGKLPTDCFGIKGVSISPDGLELAVCGNGLAPTIWNTQTRQIHRTFPEALNDFRTLAWSRDGRWIATGATDRIIRVYDARSGLLHRQLRGTTHAATSSAFLPEDNLLLTTGFADEGGVRVWSPESPVVPRRVAAHIDDIGSLAFSPDSSQIVSVGTRCRLTLVHDVATGEVTRMLKSSQDHQAARFAVDSRGVLVLGERGSVESWPPDSPGHLLLEPVAPTPTTVCRISPTSRGVVRMPVESDAPIFVDDQPLPLEMPPDSRWLSLSVNAEHALRRLPDQSIEVISLASGQRTGIIPAASPANAKREEAELIGSNPIVGVAQGDDLHLYTVDGTSIVTITDAIPGRLCTELSSDQRRLFIGYKNGEFRCWDLPSGTIVLSSRLGVHWIEVMRLSPDGRTLVLGESSGFLTFFESGPRASPPPLLPARRTAMDFAIPLLESGCPPEKVRELAAQSLPLDAAHEVNGVLTRHSSTHEGLLESCLLVFADNGSTVLEQRRAGLVLSALIRNAPWGVRPFVVSALAHLRRSEWPTHELDPSLPHPIETAKLRLESARNGLQTAVAKDRALFEVIERLVVLKTMDNAAALPPLTIPPDVAHPESAVAVLLKQTQIK